MANLKNWDRILAIFLLVVWIMVIIGFLLPSRHPFEGSLLAEEMNFTYNGESDKLLFNNIEQLRSLDIQGSQPKAITLTGKIENINDTEIKEKLSQSSLDKLKIELIYPTSHVVFKGEITLSELRINPETRINQLSYHSKDNYLSLCLQSTSLDSSSECISPESLDESNKKQLGKFNIKLGQKPIKVSLTGYNLPDLGIKKELGDSTALEFTFTPDNDEYNLILISPSKLYIDLPAPKLNVDSSQWFGQELNVKHVSFTRSKTTANVIEELETSTILEGKIRMAKQEIVLQERQFLTFDNQSGINKLAYLEIQKEKKDESEKTLDEQPGLKVFVIGESTKVFAGLSKNFPVQTINPSWLSKFSQEAVNAFLAFLGAVSGVFLGRLISQSP